MQNSVRLIAAAKQVYEGKPLSVNDPFETDEEQAADLVAMGFATRAPEDPKKRSYRRRDMEAE